MSIIYTKKIQFREILGEIWQSLEEGNKIPKIDCFEYLCSEKFIETRYVLEYEVYHELEGYCLEIGVSEKGPHNIDYFPIGTIHSHRDGKQAYDELSALGAEFKYLFAKVMGKDKDDYRFTWRGYALRWVTDEGESLRASYTRHSQLSEAIEEIRSSVKDRLTERAAYVEVYDLAERRDIVAKYIILTDEVRYLDVKPETFDEYRVCITQMLSDGEVVGKAILTESFSSREEARKKALAFSKPYPIPIYEIRGYNSAERNVISFDENDTGTVVY